MAQQVEQQVSQAILQMPTEVRVGDKSYMVAPPSVATIIMVSRYTATLPNVKFDDKTMVEDILRHAKDCEALGHIAAVLVLGAKGIKERVVRRQRVRESRFFGLFHREREVEVTEDVDRLEPLAKELLEGLSPIELHSLISQILAGLQLGDFFGLTTFLCEINLTRPTKVD